MTKIKLFCLPHAGGSAFNYSKWKKYFNPFIEVIPIELAGRGYRMEESLYHSIEEAVNDVYKIIVKHLNNSPYILYGHSMGSLIAYELARKIQNSNNVLPEFLVLSGRNHPNSKIKDIRHNLPNDFLILNGKNDELTSYEEIKKWEQYTNKMCTFHSFKGKHFFLHGNIEEIASIIIRKLVSQRPLISF